MNTPAPDSTSCYLPSVLLLCAAVCVLGAFTIGCNRVQGPYGTAEGGSSGAGTAQVATEADDEERQLAELRARIEQLYGQVKEDGKPVADGPVEWALADVQRIGDWEYRVVSLQLTTDMEMEARLNEIGRDRWEAFWVDRREKQIRIFFRRPARSYLKNAMEMEPWKLIPGEASGAE